MFRTDDNYNLYYDGAISGDQETAFQTLIAENQLSPEVTELLQRHYNFRIKNAYEDHRKLLWVLYKTLGPFAVTILFAEEEHPHGCEYQARVDFYVDASGSFDYELKNNLFLYETKNLSDECEERLAQKSIGFEADRRIKGNLMGMDLETFLERTTTE